MSAVTVSPPSPCASNTVDTIIDGVPMSGRVALVIVVAVGYLPSGSLSVTSVGVVVGPTIVPP